MSTPDEPLHLYLLMGQSNMVGRDAIADEDRWTDPRIVMWTLDGKWAQAQNPLPHTDGGSNGVGPGMTFARVMIEQDASTKIGLIPTAVGGTPLSRWVKGADLYENAVAQARAAMRDGVLKGVLWHQGESDSDTAEHANTYLDRLTQMFADLRNDLNSPDVPIVVGEVGHFITVDPYQHHFHIVNAALAQVPERVAHSGFVRADGLGCMDDKMHFTTEALREYGRRYAKEMIAVQAAARYTPSP